ncbi:MAG: hypothetical protein U0133_01335 [Gemmatimonadales bacterium]
MLAASMALAASSAISALRLASITAASTPEWTRKTDPPILLKVGQAAGVAKCGACSSRWSPCAFHLVAGGGQTPVVVFALSIASITYGALEGVPAGGGPAQVTGRRVIAGIAVAVAVMLVIFFAKALSGIGGLDWLAPAATLAWPLVRPAGLGDHGGDGAGAGHARSWEDQGFLAALGMTEFPVTLGFRIGERAATPLSSRGALATRDP